MMADGEPEELPMLNNIRVDPNDRLRSRIARGNSKRVAPDVPHENLFRSGPLGKCDDPLCTTCPTYFGDLPKKSKTRLKKRRAIWEWCRKSWLATLSFWRTFPRGVINPHTKFMQRWNKIFVISCLIGVFLDPLFFFLLAVDEEKKCIMIDQKASTTIVVLRSITDSIYFMHILLQFRLAYVAPSFRMREPRSIHRQHEGARVEVSATREIVDDPKKIAWNYMTGWLLNDLIAVLPLPQVMIKVIVPKYLGKASGATFAKNALRATLLFQNLFRIARVSPLLFGHTSSGFIFETAWANFVINLLLYLLAGHVVGSLWYLFGLQRVNRCLHNACQNASGNCTKSFLDCGVDGSSFVFNGINGSLRELWKKNTNAIDCLKGSSAQTFTYGIYGPAVAVTMLKNGFRRYIFSFVWGFQQISTLAGNQIPSLFIWEVLFVMTIIGLGLMLLTLLIGNMQNFLQSFGRRPLEMQLRRYEYDKWMTRRHLPLDLQSRVKQYERFNWAATKGVSEDELLRDLPEDLHRAIRRTLFVDLVKKVRLLEVMDEQLLDAIFQRLHQKLYIPGCEILRASGPVDQMLFIVHGTLESRGEDGSVATLKSGDICGEELLTWCLEHATSEYSSLKPASSEQALNQHKPRTKRSRFGYITGQLAISSRTVISHSNVEAFSLEAADLKEVTQDFERLLRNPRVRAAIRYESNFMRSWAAVTIQVFWRYKRKKLGRARTLPHHTRKSGEKRLSYYRLGARGHT